MKTHLATRRLDSHPAVALVIVLLTEWFIGLILIHGVQSTK
jgi:hypothetical protein